MLVFPDSFQRVEQCLRNLRLHKDRRRCLKVRVQHLFGVLCMVALFVFFDMLVYHAGRKEFGLDVSLGFGQPSINPLVTFTVDLCRISDLGKPIQYSESVSLTSTFQ